MIIILSECGVSAVRNTKMTDLYDEDSLSPDNSNPMQIKLSDFSLNLYLVGAISHLLLLFLLKPPFVVSSPHVKSRL